MTTLILTLIILVLIAFVVSFVLSRKFAAPKYEKSNAELRCTIFTTIFTPVLTMLSVVLVVCTLQLDYKNSKQDSYNTEFSMLFAEMKDFINSLSVEIKYNEHSEKPITISKMEVIDELAYYLKRGEKVRQLYAEEVSQINFSVSKSNTWLTTEIDDFYIENGKCYQIKIRPELERQYFESINKRFRNIFTPIFELLDNVDNEHRETHKHLFASYMNKNFLEAYLTTRWKEQDIPDTLIEIMSSLFNNRTPIFL